MALIVGIILTVQVSRAPAPNGVQAGVGVSTGHLPLMGPCGEACGAVNAPWLGSSLTKQACPISAAALD